MAYTPTVWATGDTITAEKLNKAEQGIAAASEIVGLFPIGVTVEGSTATLDQKYSDILAAVSAGKFALIYQIVDGEYSADYVLAMYEDSGVYTVSTKEDATYTTDSEDGYPSTTIG